MIVNYNCTVITIVKYDRKTFLVQATDWSRRRHKTRRRIKSRGANDPQKKAKNSQTVATAAADASAWVFLRRQHAGANVSPAF